MSSTLLEPPEAPPELPEGRESVALLSEHAQAAQAVDAVLREKALEQHPTAPSALATLLGKIAEAFKSTFTPAKKKREPRGIRPEIEELEGRAA